MTTSAALGGQSPRFDAFLFAPVGEDRNGMLVSVLSALARLGVDPWAEAAALTELPQGAARERLDAMLVGFGDVPSVAPDHGRIVARLIALLPPRGATRPAPAGVAAAARSRSSRVLNAMWIGLLLVMVIGQAMAPRPDAPAAGTGNAFAPSGNQALDPP
jgi:hypothetical protein